MEEDYGDELARFSTSPTANQDTPSPTFPPPQPSTAKKTSENYAQSKQTQNQGTQKQ